MESLAFAAPIAPDHHQLIVVITEGERSSVFSVFSCVFLNLRARESFNGREVGPGWPVLQVSSAASAVIVRWYNTMYLFFIAMQPYPILFAKSLIQLNITKANPLIIFWLIEAFCCEFDEVFFFFEKDEWRWLHFTRNFLLSLSFFFLSSFTVYT